MLNIQTVQSEHKHLCLHLPSFLENKIKNKTGAEPKWLLKCKLAN